MALLSALANELLDEIVLYIPSNSDRLSMLRSCRGLHWPVARQLYRNVSVSDYRARRFFKTITESVIGYQDFTKSLVYRASSNNDVHLTHILLRDAIPRLASLQHLSLLIRSGLSPFLIYILRRSVNVSNRTPHDFESGYFIPRAGAANTFRGLPSIRTFRVQGDIRLVKLLSYSRIEKMEISEPMADDEFNYFLHVVAPDDAENHTMTHLTVTFQKPVRMNLVGALVRLGKCFPNLRRLSIRGLRLNALDVSQVMTLRPPLFPSLERLEVNQISMAIPDEYLVDERNPIDVQSMHVIEAGSLRPTLRCMTFGNLAWEIQQGTGKWKASFQINASQEDIALLPVNFSGRPSEWVVEYTEPVDISVVQSFYSKQV